ncbi:MAG: ABC transporter permease subunit [Verrucomicrobiales bacterium]
MIQPLKEDALPKLDTFALAKGNSLWSDAWRRLRKNHVAFASIFILAFIVLACLLGPVVAEKTAGYTYRDQDLLYGAQGPSAEHWFGTDEKGRDLFVRTLDGGRVSLTVGFLATAVAVFVGVSFGAISGYSRPLVDDAMMRFVEILLALPFLIMVILIRVFFGDEMYKLYLTIGLLEWLVMARIVRGQVQSLRKQEFTEAAVSLGLSSSQIIFRHLVPNVLGVVVVYATLTVPAVMLLEAALSFLGLGTKPPDSSWGELLNEGAQTMETHPWRLFFPALFFSVTLFCLNFLGDGLRDALDPKASKD